MTPAPGGAEAYIAWYGQPESYRYGHYSDPGRVPCPEERPCDHCGAAPGGDFQVHHVMPLDRRGGVGNYQFNCQNHQENLVWLCGRCHRAVHQKLRQAKRHRGTLLEGWESSTHADRRNSGPTRVKQLSLLD